MAAVLDRLTAVVSPAAQRRAGLRLLESGQGAAGFHLLAKAARRGDAEAEYRVGRCYLEGVGVPVSRGDAAQWLDRAARAGRIEAQATLAALHLMGVAASDHGSGRADLFAGNATHEPDYDAAEQWARRAAEGGAPDGQALLGYILTSGPEAKRDLAQAADWYRRSAEAGCPQGELGHALALLRAAPAADASPGAPDQARAQAVVQMAKAAAAGLPTAIYLLGVMTEFAVGIERDLEAAARLYKQAAEKGVRSGQARWGLALMEGRGVARDPTTGESWLRRAGNAGDGEAAALVGDLYAKGGELPPNYAEAAIWYERAAEAGHSAAARALGLLYLTGGGVARDPDDAARWFRRSAELGNRASQADLANLVLSGSGERQDKVRTREWFEQAAAGGDLVAAFNFGVCLAEGVGIERDERKAALWLRRAADGVVNAQVPGTAGC